MNECRVEAPAKINLSLDITGRRHDGYHILRMVLQSVTLCDYLLIRKTNGDGIEVRCDRADLPCGDTNLAYRAALAFFLYTGLAISGILIVIEKEIPMEAGLAGGSADAAATLVGLNALFETSLDMHTLCEIGLTLGADVPFAIVGGTVLAEGIGEIFDILPALPKCYFVIAKPKSGTSTKNAYALFDEHIPLHHPDTDMMVAAVTTGRLENIGAELYNVLEEVSNTPEIADIKQRMLENDSLGAIMSGSGSAVFALFDSKSKAKNCLAELSDRYSDTFLVKPCDHGAVVTEIN